MDLCIGGRGGWEATGSQCNAWQAGASWFNFILWRKYFERKIKLKKKMTNFEERGGKGEDLSGHLHPRLHQPKVNWQKCHYWQTSIHSFTKSPKNLGKCILLYCSCFAPYIHISCHTNSISYLWKIIHSSKKYLYDIWTLQDWRCKVKMRKSELI